MPEKRILLSINVRWWNAEAAYALNLALGLQAAGHKVWMIVNSGSPVHLKAESRHIPVITDILLDSTSPLQQVSNLRRLLQVVDAYGIQLIDSFKSNGAFLFSLLKRLRPGICHVKTRGEARPPHRNFMNRMLYKSCDGIIAVGSPVRGWLEDLGIEGQDIDVIHYGDRGMERAPRDITDTVRDELGIDKDALILTLLGRTQAVKGHRVLLEAMAGLKSDTLHLLFLVKDLEEFPDELRSLEGYIAANRLTERVNILGFQEDLTRVLSVTDLGVIPSLDSEVNCRVAVEFFSLGVPVLSFSTGTLPDIIRHQENGYLTSEKTVDGLMAGIGWFSEAPVRLKKCGEKAKIDFESYYTLEKMTRNTLKFYERCCPEI